MDPFWQVIWFGLAFFAFLLAAFAQYNSTPERPWLGPHFGWLGLAFFTVVFLWTAVKAA